jgi:tetratricopeptide (TPR) repeat protein
LGNNPDFWVTLGHEQYKLEQREQALKSLKKALDLAPNYGPARQRWDEWGGKEPSGNEPIDE